MLKTRSLPPVAPGTEPPSQGSELPVSSAATALYLKIGALLVLFLLAVFVLFPHLKTGFTTKDDTEYALYAAHPSQWLDLASGMAASQGRFYQLFSMLGDFAAHYFSNPACYYLIYLGSILLNIGLFYILVRHIFRSELVAILAAALCLTFLQNNWHHCLLTSYPFMPHFAFSCLMLAFISFFRWQETTRFRFAALTAILYFLSLLVYEAFVPYILLFALASFFPVGSHKHFFSKRRLAAGVKALSPIVITLLVYLACYVGYRAAHPSQYDGSKLAAGEISRVIAVIWRYTSSTLPSYFYFKDPLAVGVTFDGYSPHVAGVGELLTNCRVEWLAKAIIAAVLSAFVLQALRHAPKRTSLLRPLVAGLGGIVLPVCLLGLTSKYQEWVLQYGSLAHSASYFAYFGMIVLIVSILLYLNKAAAGWHLLSLAYVILTSGIIAGASLATDYYNYYITLDQQLSHLKWRTVGRFVQTDDFKAVPSDSVILAPSLWQYRGIVANGETYWSDYVTQKSGKRIWVVQTSQQFGALLTEGTDRQGYFLAFEQEPKEPNQFLVFSKLVNNRRMIDGPVYANEFTLFSYSKNRKFTLIGESSPASQPVRININGHAVDEIENGIFFARVDQSDNREDFPKVIVNSTAPVDIAHLVVSFFPVEPGRKGVEIIYGRGFHGLEKNGAAGLVWNWSRAESEIAFANYSDHPVGKSIQFQLTVFTPRTVALKVNQIQEQIEFAAGGTKLVNLPNVILQPGENKLFLTSDQPAFPPGNGDPRLMAFGVQNLLVTDPGK